MAEVYGYPMYVYLLRYKTSSFTGMNEHLFSAVFVAGILVKWSTGLNGDRSKRLRIGQKVDRSKR